VDLAKRKLGFVLVATIIGTPQSTRQTESAHAIAIGVRRQRPAAANSISSIVGGPPRPSGLKSEEPGQFRTIHARRQFRDASHCTSGRRSTRIEAGNVGVSTSLSSVVRNAALRRWASTT
jgi:hypothetical protein